MGFCAFDVPPRWGSGLGVGTNSWGSHPWWLEYAFRPDQVRIRKQDGMRYIDGASVIQRLNDVLGPDGWSVKLLGEPQQLADRSDRPRPTRSLNRRPLDRPRGFRRPPLHPQERKHGAPLERRHRQGRGHRLHKTLQPTTRRGPGIVLRRRQLSLIPPHSEAAQNPEPGPWHSVSSARPAHRPQLST